MELKKIQQVPADVLVTLDKTAQKMETSCRRDQIMIREQTDKYKQLKRRVRDYQKYASEKLEKYKTERQQSEDYCRHVISELLQKVTQELQKVEHDRQNVALSSKGASSFPAANGNHSESKSTFARSIDDLQDQVNRYVIGLTNFSNMK